MVGKGKIPKNNAPDARQSFELVNQMLAALQIVAAQQEAERQEEEQYWTQVETPPPEAFAETTGASAPSVPVEATRSEADRNSAGRNTSEQTQRSYGCDAATSPTMSTPPHWASSSSHPSQHGGARSSPSHPASRSRGSGGNDHPHSGGGGSSYGGSRSNRKDYGESGGSGSSYGGGSGGNYRRDGGNRAEGSRVGIRWYCVTKGRSVGIFYGWSNVAPLVNNISGGTQASYPTFATALDAFMEAANRGAVELVLP